MARARQQAEELRCRVDEVENLRNEQEKQGFAEMTQYPHNCKNHASKVAIRISHKHLSRVPVVRQKCDRDANEGKKEVQREEMRISRRVRIGRKWSQEHSVVDHE